MKPNMERFYFLQSPPIDLYMLFPFVCCACVVYIHLLVQFCFFSAGLSQQTYRSRPVLCRFWSPPRNQSVLIKLSPLFQEPSKFMRFWAECTLSIWFAYFSKQSTLSQIKAVLCWFLRGNRSEESRVGKECFST